MIPLSIGDKMAEVRWEPKQAAYRDLVLLALHRRGGELRDDEGGATALLLGECGIEKSRKAMSNLSTAARMMQDAGLIEREVTAGSKRTYLFRLRAPLSEDQVRLLSTKEGPNRAMCETASRPSEKHDNGDWLTPLFEDCLRAQAALREAFEAAEHKGDRLAVFNATRVLEARGIRGKRADEVRHYLREFGLARATTRFEGDTHLYWWEVSFSKELDREKLRKKAMGSNAYGGFRRQAPILEETSATRRHAKGVPSQLDDALCTPVIVRQKPVQAPDRVTEPAEQLVLQSDGEQAGSETTVPLSSPVTAEEVRGRFQELISGFDALEQDLIESENARRTLESEHNQCALEREKALREQADEYEEKLALLRAELEAEKTRAETALNELNTWAGTMLGRITRRLKGN